MTDNDLYFRTITVIVKTGKGARKLPEIRRSTLGFPRQPLRLQVCSDHIYTAKKNHIYFAVV